MKTIGVLQRQMERSDAHHLHALDASLHPSDDCYSHRTKCGSRLILSLLSTDWLSSPYIV